MNFVRRAAASTTAARSTLSSLSHGTESIVPGSRTSYSRPPPNPHKIVAALFATAAACTTANADVAPPTYANFYSSTSPQPVPNNLQSVSINSSSSVPDSKPTSQWDNLLRNVGQADAQAIHTLSIVLGDPKSHQDLLNAGVVQSLTNALNVIRTSSDDNRSLVVNLFRVFADLSKNELSHPQFDNSQFLSLFKQYLSDAIYATIPGWGEWLGSLFSWSSSKTKIEKKEESNTVEQNADDFLLKPIELSTTPQDVNLDEGIAYHAMRCASNLSKNSALHKSLIQSDLLDPLCFALSRSKVDDLIVDNPMEEQMVDMLRCNITAVSAIAKTAPADVIARGGHKQLISFTEQSIDKVAQMYAAGGIRNLARHSVEEEKHRWRAHRELVVNGAAQALSKAMSRDSNPQTKSFAMLAFADLMSTQHPKADIIQKRLADAYDNFASLLKDKNPRVEASTFRALIVMCENTTDNAQGREIPEQLARKVAEESGQLVNGAVARGNVAALKAVRTMCHNNILSHGMVDKGLIEVLLKGSKQGKGEYWEQSIATLSVLSSQSDFVPLLVSRKVLRAVAQRPCLENDARWTASFFANIARNEDYQVDVAHGGLKTLIIAASSRNNEAMEEGIRGLYNLSLGGISKVMVCQSGALHPLIKAAGGESKKARRLAVGTIAEISEFVEQAKRFVEADVLQVLLKAERNDPSVAKFVAKCIGQLSQVAEVHGSLAKSGAAEWCMDKVMKNGGRGPDAADVMHYASFAVCNISSSPGITREVLRANGAVSVLTALTSSVMHAPVVVFCAKQALKNLKGIDKPVTIPVDPSGAHPLPA